MIIDPSLVDLRTLPPAELCPPGVRELREELEGLPTCDPDWPTAQAAQTRAEEIGTDIAEAVAAASDEWFARLEQERAAAVEEWLAAVRALAGPRRRLATIDGLARWLQGDKYGNGPGAVRGLKTTEGGPALFPAVVTALETVAAHPPRRAEGPLRIVDLDERPQRRRSGQRRLGESA